MWKVRTESYDDYDPFDEYEPRCACYKESDTGAYIQCEYCENRDATHIERFGSLDADACHECGNVTEDWDLIHYGPGQDLPVCATCLKS